MLHVRRSERADALVGPLAETLAAGPDDPFAADVVAVPTRGVEVWLAQRLAHLLGADPAGEGGVCANVFFPSPRDLVGRAVAQALGTPPDDDPWATDRLVWAVLAAVDEARDAPWCRVVQRYLGDPGDDLRRGRRLGLARRVAGLFADYACQRPELLTGWAGHDGAGRAPDGAGGEVPDDLAWQPALWRAVRDRLGVPGPAERLDGAVTALRTDPGRCDLPGRLSVFGPTRLPEDQLRVLHALAAHREIHLWLVHPSPALWAAGTRVPAAPSRRRRDVAPRAAHPLLASMARDVTELQARLAALPTGVAAVTDTAHPAADPPATLLGALQRAVRADTDPEGGAGRVPLAPGDRSIEVHACHGPARQVEVLREVLVGLLEDDPTLEPRDVLVMCPDVEAVAPLVAAAFGLCADGGAADRVHPGQRLRVRLADRSLRSTNPLLDLLATLLALADARVTVCEVLDLAATGPVRRRFGFDDDDLARIRGWAAAAGVHWGEDLRRRARFGLPRLRQGTWDAGLDRILLGAAMADEGQRFVGSALPLDDVDSTDIDLAGRLAELVDRVTAVLAGLGGSRPVGAWLDTLDEALDLLAQAPPDEAWQLAQARQVLADVRRGAAGQDADLRLADVRALLADRFAGRPGRAGLRSGALTVCSLEPMRAVPHRVVCLLGLDDGAFPRGTGGDGDDLLLREPCTGERDRRSEDRQLFLDAVTAAGEKLVLLYSGADERTGAVLPPAVPVTELLDALDRSASTADGRDVREHVVVRHPLQPVSPRCFTPGALGRPGPFSFDAAAHRAAVAGRGERVAAAPFLPRPLPAPPAPGSVDVDDLVALLEHPVRWFLRHRLAVVLPGETGDVDDRLPLELAPLTRWAIGDRLLSARLAGADRARAVNAEWRRGEVPPRELGRAALHSVGEQVVPVAAAVAPHLVGTPAVVDVAADTAAGVTVTGSIGDVRGDTVVRAVFSRLAAKHRVRAWVRLLALTAAEPDRPWRAVTVGRSGGRRNGALVATLRAPAGPVAAQRLEDLVRLREHALRAPLPMPVATAAAYARSRLAGDSEAQALAEAVRAWGGEYGEGTDRHHVLCWGEGAALADVAGRPERGESAWSPDGTDRTRLGVLALRVWGPLLAHEEVRPA